MWIIPYVRDCFESTRVGKYDYILKYKNEKGDEITEPVTKFTSFILLSSCPLHFHLFPCPFSRVSSKSPENYWGPALATLLGATSEAIKSRGMERHISMGLIIKSNVDHPLCERLFRINKSWSKISKSIRSGKYDYILKYKNEKGDEITEPVTKFSAGLILAIINTNDGSKEEKFSRKLERKDKGKDGNEEKDDGEVRLQWGREKRRIKEVKETSHKLETTLAEDEFVAPTEPKEERPYLGVDSETQADKTMCIQSAMPTTSKSIVTSSSILEKEEEKDQNLVIPEINSKTAGEYLEKRYKYPPFDYNKAPEPFPIRMVSHGVYTSSDSDSEATAEFKEESRRLDSPASPILVKHGTKRPAEAGVIDVDSKLAKEMASQTTDDENKGGGSMTFP